ncbi:MAG: DUF58 domain-containing protein [Vicingaceae bacterium]
MPAIDRTQIQAYSHLELLAKQVVEGFITGLHKSPFHGFSVEFAEHRLYNTGESTRHLDWKLFAKTDKLFVKRYEEETNLRCRIIMDVSTSMQFPEKVEKGKHNKLQFSIYAAAALVELLRRQRDAYGLSLFSDKIEFHSEAKSNAAHQRLVYNQLEKLLEGNLTQKSTSAVDALHHISEMIHKRSLVIIFSDMLDNSDREDDLLSALQHLKHNKHEIILFHVVDQKTELDFDFENRPYRFVDMESGEEVKLNPNEVKEQYVKEVKEREKELRLKCGQYGIDFVSADVGKSFNQVLLPFLTKRKKLY